MAASPAKLQVSRHLYGRGSLRLPRLTLILAAVMVALHGLAGPASELLVLDRQAVIDGELWRLISGHWVHSDGEHLVWNVAGLLVLGWLFEPLLQKRLLVVLLIGTVGVDLAIWHALPELELYCGLSGILNSLLAAGLCQMWRETRAPLVIVTGAGAVAKIAIETLSTTALFTQSTWPSVPPVHAAGFAAGILWWMLSSSSRSIRDDLRLSTPTSEI